MALLFLYIQRISRQNLKGDMQTNHIVDNMIMSLRGLAGLSKGSVQVGEYTIVYLEGGTGESVLLLHGFGGDKDNWTLFSQYLTKRYHVIAPDLPGFGESSKIWSDPYNIAAQVERVHQFAKEIGLKRFHLAGNSMGGLIAGVYAAMYPDELLTLGLLDPAGVTEREPSPLSLELEKGNNPLIVESASDYDKLLDFTFVKPPPLPDPLKSHFAETAVRSKDFHKKIFIEATPGNQLEVMMRKIRAKTLILWGDTDRVLSVSSAQILQQGIERSKVVILKDCGHLPMIERPEETARHYLEFIS
jgi:abhydrolase domain-containing protein 6